MITYLCTYSFFVFNLDNPVAPQQRNQNFSSAILRASGARPCKEAPGMSSSVNSKAPNRNDVMQENKLATLVSPNENGGLPVSMVFTKRVWFCKASITIIEIHSQYTVIISKSLGTLYSGVLLGYSMLAQLNKYQLLKQTECLFQL